MQKIKFIFIKGFLIFLCFTLVLCGCAKTNEYYPITDFTPHKFKYAASVYSYGYLDIGVCRKLVGDVYTLVIFLNDDESSWNEEARDNFYNKRYFPSINYLTEQAELRGVELTLQSGQYTTRSDLKTPPRYYGTVAASAESLTESADILEQAAQTLGFTDSAYMHAFLKNNLGVEQIAYVLALNKSGRAYAVYDSTYNGKESVEFIVTFSSNEQGKDNVGSSILHELLHLFGATDLYDDTGKFKKRFELCRELYPNDIMMKSAVNPGSLEIGRLTECLIGWSDYFPPECDCPEWWE